MIRSALITGGICLLATGAVAQEAGADLFEAHCAACHNSGGTGTPGLAPPLDRPDFWQALGDDAPTYLGGVITKGLNMPLQVRGEHYAGMPMTPVAGASDEELAGIASWVLQELGETDLEVAVVDIAAARDGDTTSADLKALRPETE